MALALPNAKSMTLNPETPVNFLDDVTAGAATVIDSYRINPITLSFL